MTAIARPRSPKVQAKASRQAATAAAKVWLVRSENADRRIRAPLQPLAATGGDRRHGRPACRLGRTLLCSAASSFGAMFFSRHSVETPVTMGEEKTDDDARANRQIAEVGARQRRIRKVADRGRLTRSIRSLAAWEYLTVDLALAGHAGTKQSDIKHRQRQRLRRAGPLVSDGAYVTSDGMGARKNRRVARRG